MGSDKGKEFVKQLVAQLCNACGIEHKVTSAYHPQANGHTEKFNDTLINMLKKLAEENPDDWEKWLPFVLLAYRTRVHTTTGHTPFELMFGRTMNEFDDYSFTQDQKQREFVMNNDHANKPIINGISKSTISYEENRKVKSWQTREALNKSEKNSIKGRSKSPVFWKTPNADTKKIWRKFKNSRSRSHSRSPSAAYGIRDKNKLKAVN